MFASLRRRRCFARHYGVQRRGINLSFFLDAVSRVQHSAVVETDEAQTRRVTRRGSVLKNQICTFPD